MQNREFQGIQVHGSLQRGSGQQVVKSTFGTLVFIGKDTDYNIWNIMLLYKLLMILYLVYCMHFWKPSYRYVIKLKTVQMRSTRMMPGLES